MQSAIGLCLLSPHIFAMANGGRFGSVPRVSNPSRWRDSHDTGRDLGRIYLGNNESATRKAGGEGGRGVEEIVGFVVVGIEWFLVVSTWFIILFPWGRWNLGRRKDST